MRLARLIAALMAVIMSLPAAGWAFGPYPYDSWEFTLEFRRMPMAPSCQEKFGKGRLVREKGGRNPVYKLTGFPEASIIACRFPNGGTFEIDAAWYFDIPSDGFWRGPVELMGPGDIRSVRARYTHKGTGPFVEGTYHFETVKGRYKGSGGSVDMYDALTKGARR